MVNGNYIVDPVSIYDLKKMFGLGYGDLGTLITRADINKWSQYKPVVRPTVGVLTEADLKACKYGLTPTANTAASSALLKSAGSVSEADMNAARNASADGWTYNRPTGDNASPFRLSDFASVEYGKGWMGYCQTTEAPLYLRADNWSISIDNLKKAADRVGVRATAGSGLYDWVVTAGELRQDVGTSGSPTMGTDPGTTLAFTSVAFRYGTRSEQNIGGVGTNVIKLNDVFDYDVNANGYAWRLGVLVFVEGISGNQVIPNDTMGLFVSRSPLASTDVSVPNNFLPDLVTNQVLAQRMYVYMTSKNLSYHSFKALPVLVRNAQISDGNGGSARSYVYQNDLLEVYNLPVAYPNFSVAVINNEEVDEQQNNPKNGTSNGWNLGNLGTGVVVNLGEGQSQYNSYINYIAIYREDQPTRSYNYNVVCTVFKRTGKTTTEERQISRNGSIGPSSKLPGSHSDKYGIILDAGPNAYITKITTFECTAI